MHTRDGGFALFVDAADFRQHFGVDLFDVLGPFCIR